MVTLWNRWVTHADTLGLGELVCNPRVTLALAVTLAPTLAPSKVHDDVRVGG